MKSNNSELHLRYQIKNKAALGNIGVNVFVIIYFLTRKISIQIKRK